MVNDDGGWRREPSSWVLDHGLPSDIPEAVLDDLLVPIAYWIGGSYGVVLSLQWDIEDDGERSLSTEAELYQRRGGSWEPISGGGGVWPNARLVPLMTSPRGCEFWHLHSSGYKENAVVTVYGVVGSDARSVTVKDSHGEITQEVDSPVGAVIVLAEPRPEATAIVHDAGGVPIGGVVMDWTVQFRPIEFPTK